jgi:hypothetical protein
MGHRIGKTQWPEMTPQRRLITPGSLLVAGDEPVIQSPR